MLPKAQPTWSPSEAAHLLNRAGFGGGPAEIEKLHSMGREKAVESLISPAEPIASFPLPAWAETEQMVADLKARAEELRAAQKEAKGLPPEAADMKLREVRRGFQVESRRRAVEAQEWWYHRMMKSQAPLREKMVLFWHDHFATSIQKVKQPAFLIRQNDLFRRSAFGSSRDLTQAILMDPAMVLYLDTQSSKKGQPNENFAREVMELFTLGEGNYTEEDVHEAARAFSGYQLNRSNGQVFHNRRQWDETAKTVFNQTGKYNGRDVINLIFAKKEAARFMTKKIWEFFVYENPPEAAVNQLAEGFQQSDFKIAPLLREIFLSKEFYSVASVRTQIKCPAEYLVGLLKELEITSPPRGFLLNASQQLGQILFAPPNVAGWDWGKAWINTNTLLTRYNLAGNLTKGADTNPNQNPNQMMANAKPKTAGMGGGAQRRAAASWKGPDYEKIAPRPTRTSSATLVDSLISRFFQGPVPEKARASFIDYAETKKGEIFTNKETAELVHLMLSTPYYQLC